MTWEILPLAGYTLSSSCFAEVGQFLQQVIHFPATKFCTLLMVLGLSLCANLRCIAAESEAKAAHEHRQASGIKADFAIVSQHGANELSAGSQATLEFRLSDAKTAKPLTGLNPLAWVVQDDLDKPVNGQQCQALIHQLHHGQLSQQPAVNLSSFLVLTLNQDHTISVVDPQIAWSKTKLLSIVELPGKGDDWLLDARRERLYVALPEQASIAVIDTENWRISNTINLGVKAKAAQMALSPSGDTLWLVLDAQPEVLAVATATLKIAARIPIKPGQHSIALSEDGHSLLVTSGEADTVSVIDTQNLKAVAEIDIPGYPVAVAANPLNGLIYVAAKNAAEIKVIDHQKKAIVASIPVDSGISQLRFNHDGRHGFALHREQGQVSLIDASQQKVVATTLVAAQPDQVLFSEHYAYVRSLASAQYAVFDLIQVAKGILAQATVAAGQKPALSDPGAIGHTDMVAPTPDGHGAILANGPDRKLYYYMEGMMAASGTLDNGGRVTTGILLLDRGLKETKPGRYSVSFKLPAAGNYDLPLFVGNPSFSDCFKLKVAASDQGQGHAAQIRPVVATIEAKAGETVDLAYLVEEVKSGQPIDTLSDVQILITEIHGGRQSKRRASFDKSGIYKIRQRFQNPGIYGALVRVPSLGIDFKRISQIQINVLPQNAR